MDQLEDIRQAHADLEANKVAGKLVGLTEDAMTAPRHGFVHSTSSYGPHRDGG